MDEQERILLVRKVSQRLFVALLIFCLILIVALYLPIYFQGYGALGPVVVVVGAIGGFVSLQKRIKQIELNDLRLLSESALYTILAPFVGGILSLVLYLLFLSGLLNGSLFPNFIPDPCTPHDAVGISKLFHMVGKTTEDYAKLLFWSFLAGYSEKFVVNIIGKFEDIGTDA